MAQTKYTLENIRSTITYTDIACDININEEQFKTLKKDCAMKCLQFVSKLKQTTGLRTLISNLENTIKNPINDNNLIEFNEQNQVVNQPNLVPVNALQNDDNKVMFDEKIYQKIQTMYNSITDKYKCQYSKDQLVFNLQQLKNHLQNMENELNDIANQFITVLSNYKKNNDIAQMITVFITDL
jgi:hypothetical protein